MIWILIEITAIFIVKLIVIRDIKISLFIFITVYVYLCPTLDKNISYPIYLCI